MKKIIFTTSLISASDRSVSKSISIIVLVVLATEKEIQGKMHVHNCKYSNHKWSVDKPNNNKYSNKKNKEKKVKL